MNLLSGFSINQIKAGESLWPTNIQKAQDGVTAAMDAARVEHDDIDLGDVESQLATLDSSADALLEQITQSDLEKYFEDQFEELNALTSSLQSQRGNYLPSTSTLNQNTAEYDAIQVLIDQSAQAYPDVDLTAIYTRYDTLRTEFDSVTLTLKKQGEARNYFESLTDVVSPLGSHSSIDLDWNGDDILNSGIEQLDVGAVRERIASEGSAAGNSRGSSTLDYFASIERMMGDGSYIDAVIRYLKRANDASADIGERIDTIAKAERFALIGLRFKPDDAAHQRMLSQVQKRKSALLEEQAQRFASASTGPFHTQHIDSIVFHRAPLQIGGEDTSAVATSFMAGEPIYGTAYLSDSVRALHLNPNAPMELRLEFTFDGEACNGFAKGYVRGMSGEQMEKTYVQFALLPDLNGYEYEERNDANLLFATCVSANLGADEVEVDVALGVRDTAIVQSKEPLLGRFTLGYDDNTETRITPIINDLTAKRVDVARMPVSGMQSAELERVMLRSGEYADWEPLRAVISSTGWSIQKNDIDLPTERTLFGYVAVKKPDGECYYYQTFIDAQYSGGGTYGVPRSAGPRGGARQIRCENVDR